MTVINGLATLDEFAAFKDIETVDAVDDSVIENLLEDVSQKMFDWTGHRFYPRIETRYFSVPEDDSDQELKLDDDLLEVITITNGNGVLLSANDYYLKPRNESPKYAVVLKEMSGKIWETDAAGNGDYVIPVVAIWGYHDQYDQRAWKPATAINKVGGITAVESPITVDNGDVFHRGQIVKIQNEIMIIDSYTATNFTPMQRGDNGSTAAIHADDTPVKIWAPMGSVRSAVIDIVKSEYQRRFGVATVGTTTVTTAGMVITPEEIPADAWKVITRLKKDTVP